MNRQDKVVSARCNENQRTTAEVSQAEGQR